MSFKIFEMKYIILLIYLIGSGIFCSYPDGFEVINTFEKNGVLSVVDSYGNGVDVYIESNNIDIDTIKQEWLYLAIDEQELEDGFLMNINSMSDVYPIDTIVVIQKDTYLVKAFFLKLGDPKTHGVFEEKAMKLLRSVAQGGENEKAFPDCFNPFADFLRFIRSKG